MRGLSLLLGALAAGVPPASAEEARPDLRAPLSATVAFTAPGGEALPAIPVGAPFAIEVTLTSATGDLPRDTPLMGWLRPAMPSDLPCAETAAAYRATGRAATGSVDLNGQLYGVVNEDDTISVVDPDRSVGSANLVAARRFASAPAAITADPDRGAFLMSFPAEGLVRAVPPLGEPQVLAADLADPREVFAAAHDAVLVLERGTGDVVLIGADGALRRLPLGARAITEAPDGFAVVGSAAVSLLARDGTTIATRAAVGAKTAVPVPDGLAWIAGSTLRIAWLDGDVPQEIPLPKPYDRLAVDLEGRRLLAYGAGLAEVAVIDMARGRVVQVVGSHGPVEEIAFLPDTAFLRLADESMVGVLDLRHAKPGEPAVVGQVTLGPATDPAADPPDTVGERRLLAPLLPEPALLAVHPASFTGFVLDSTEATSGRPPMQAVRLRGGVPRMLAVLDRGLREGSPGRFRAIAELPAAGPFELVVSAGIGQMSFCAPVPVATLAVAEVESGRIRLVTEDDGSRLRLVDADGRPLADATGRLGVAALAGNWRARVDFTTDGTGTSREAWRLPRGLPLVLTAEVDDGPAFLPLLIEDGP